MVDFPHRRSSKPFVRKPGAGVKILFFIIASLVLMTVDHQYPQLEIVRSGLSTAVYPLRLAASLPYKAGHELLRSISFRNTLLENNTQLKNKNLKLRARLQQLHAIERENAHLRALMNTAAKTRGELGIGRIMSIDLDPFRQQVVINKGRQDGIYVGQPLLDADGVMGQITHAGLLTSIALLITDPNTAIPVEVARNGLRTIAIGTGDASRLDLPYLPNNADIKPGDQLVTSGLGERFPRGYPVGKVTTIDRQPGSPFAEIEARPAAELSRSHQVLLLWPPEAKQSSNDKQVAATTSAAEQ